MKKLLLAVFLLTLSPFGGLTAQEAEPERPVALDALLDVLRDDAARAALIEELQAAVEGTEAATPDALVDALADETPPPESLSFGRRVALITQTAAEEIADGATRVWSQLLRAPRVFSGLSGEETSVLLEALQDLGLIIVGTVLVYLVLRWLGTAVYARMGAKARDGGVVRTVMLYLASVLMDVLTVVVAWAAGYALAILAIGDFGTIGIRQTLYLNAFLLVEMAKVAVRMVLSPSATHLRVLPVGDRAARYLSMRLNLIVGVVGYGQLLVVPIINANASWAAGRAVSALIAVAVLLFAVWLVLRNRAAVAEWLLGEKRRDLSGPPAAERLPETAPVVREERPGGLPEDTTDLDPEARNDVLEEEAAAAEEQPVAEPPRRRRARPLAYLARNWHWPALAYLFVLFLIVLIRPGDAAFRTFVNSGQVIVVGLIGIVVSGFLSRQMVRGVILPEGINARLPLLERRLNRFVPRALFVLRLAIFVIVTLVALNAISVIDLRAWMVSQFGLRLTGTILSVAMVLVVSFAVWLALTSWVDYRLNPEYGQVATAREQTLLTLLRNAATIALIIVTLMFVLAEIGLDIAPLLASAGVLGLAIGFGAQKMVQDIITGIFIQLENAMNVGDVVTVSGTTGTVERLTIRSVSLRDLQGVYHIIPFSSVDMVSNYVKDFGYFVCDMGVAYRENVDEVKQAMMDAFAELRSDPEQASGILGDLEWFGLNSFGDSAVMLRARIKCLPGRQWGIGREYNGVLKRVFDARGIEIPFPHQTIYLGESKDGKTQSFKVDLEGAAPAAS